MYTPTIWSPFNANGVAELFWKAPNWNLPNKTLNLKSFWVSPAPDGEVSPLPEPPQGFFPRTSTPIAPRSPIYNMADESIFAKIAISHMDQFRINRRKLEELLQMESENGEPNAAVEFFSTLMSLTHTSIDWPRNLKLNGKFQKDPFVKIFGTPSNVAHAKRVILEKIPPKGPIVKLKIHICRLDHPHIIGRGGGHINGIMQATDTLIHFKDHNQKNQKNQRNSNRVSIVGTIESLKLAHLKLRATAPLTVKLQVPSDGSLSENSMKDLFAELGESLNVQIAYFTVNPTMHLVSVKGAEENNENVKQAIQKISEAYYGPNAKQSPHLQFIIAPEVVATLTKDSNKILNAIRRTTNTSVTITPLLEKENRCKAVVRGTVSGIHNAKQAIMSHFPVELGYDLDDNEQDTEDFAQICENFGLDYAVAPKERGEGNRFVIRGSEQNINDIYRAFEEILENQKSANAALENLKADAELAPKTSSG